MHNRDTNFLIDLLWFNAVHYSNLFQYFLIYTMVPTLVENSYFFLIVLVFFRKPTIIMIEITI